MVTQVLAVKARLMQQDATVRALAKQTHVSVPTAATVYVACGLRLPRTIKVLAEGRIQLRRFTVIDDKSAAIYEAKLLGICLPLAARTTPRKRERKPNQRQP